LFGLTVKELSNQLITSWIFFVQSWSGQIAGSSKIVPHTDEVEHKDSSILLAAASHFFPGEDCSGVVKHSRLEILTSWPAAKETE
jgi:hypothetical protein